MAAAGIPRLLPYSKLASSSLFRHRHSNSAATAFAPSRRPSKQDAVSGSRAPTTVPRASPGTDGVAGPDDDEDGISLGTMKLPSDVDIARFETLLFQWANSLCQGANLPLPVPLKVDKVRGGVRLGFIIIGDGTTEVPVYIDCLVSPATGSSAPLFRAVRNGTLKENAPPGEERIMRNLLQALRMSVEIART